MDEDVNARMVGHVGELNLHLTRVVDMSALWYFKSMAV